MRASDQNLQRRAEASAITVTNSHVHHCGEQGVSACILIQNNTIEWNNYANYSIG